MKSNIKKSTRRLFLTALSTVSLCCAFLGYSLIGDKTADAISSVPNSTSVSNPIYDFNNYCYDADALNELAQQILRSQKGSVSSTATMNDLITYVNSTGTQGEAIIEKTDITLKYGRYRYSTRNDYNNLVWIPVYISKTENNEAILTLYLSATSTTRATSQQESDYFSNSGSYSTNANANPPTNAYGSSHMRANVLGNGSSYAYYTGTNESSPSMYPAAIYESSCNKFSDFIDGEDFTGLLYEDIVSPSEIEWQKNESAFSSLSGSYGEYNLPNEAYGTPLEGSFPDNYNYTNKTGYSDWKDDKVWLPSLTEVGTGDGTDGIWRLTEYQKSNPEKSWLRTASTTNSYSMYCTDVDGTITTAAVYDSPLAAQGYQGCAVRPAIHLNLSKAIKKTVAPVNLPEVVTTTYNGDEQAINANKITVPEDQVKWYINDGTMVVAFYEDEDCTRGVAPITAGTYYMMVTLRNTDRKFLGTNDTFKSAKFIVEKKKIGVQWEYNNEEIPSLKTNADGSIAIIGEFYKRDIDASNVPEISVCYNNTSGVNGTFYEYPDKMGYYTATAYIIDEDLHNYNYELADVDGNKLKSNQFYVKQKKIAEPQFWESGELAGTELVRSYKGKQYIQIANVSSYVEIEVAANKEGALDTLEKMGNGESGIQLYKVEAVARYTFTIKLKDTVNTMWGSGTDTSPDISVKTLTLAINEAEIDVTFQGLPASWDTSTPMNFSLIISGTQAGEDSGVEMRVYYLTPSGSPVTLTKDATTGLYTIKSNLATGEYTLVATIAGTGQYTGNYQMNPANKTQKFTIVQTVSKFSENLVVWQYSVNGSTTTVRDVGTGNTQATAYELAFNEGYYQWSLTLDETRLLSYHVRATYTGDTYVKDAGLYSVTVAITAYDKNVVFTPQEYTVYFRIKKAVYDMSGVRWNYLNPLIYSGEEQKVLLGTLPTGLTPLYTNNAETNAGTYTASVKFLVSDDYATNYEVPVSSNTNSYSGSFNFTLEWKINPQEIIAAWNTENTSTDVFFVPKLVDGDGLVDYSYQHYVNGSWVDCDSVSPAQTVTEKYRVTAKLKQAYTTNYTLTGGDTPFEFDVESGKYPITVHFEVNNIKCDEGDEFTYTGSAFTVKVVEDSGNFTVNCDVEYYLLDSHGNKSSQLTSAPIDVGSYVAVVTTVYSSTSYLSESCETEVTFKIVPAEIDVSELKWEYTHGDVSVSASYDPDTGKWIDGAGREVVFSFVYDGSPYSLFLIGSAEGLSIGNISGNTGTDAKSYDAIAQFTVSENYKEPAFPAQLHWEIVPAKINFEKVTWGYIDDEGEHEYDFENPFPFTRDANAQENPVKFTIGLINLPAGITDNGITITYKTICLTQVDSREVVGNSFSAIGEYKTSFIMSGTFNDPNYEPFNAIDLPASIPTFQYWEIERRPLSRPSYDGAWAQFDNRVHDLIELSGMPLDELCYFKVEVTYVDTEANEVYNDYEGYDGVPYAALNAGTYIVRFYELVGDDEQPIYWDTVEIVVDKQGLEITWDLQGSIPVARVTGLYVTGMIGTRYTNENGGEVTVAYIQTTNGVKFYAEPYITTEYAQNLRFVMANNQDPKVTFYSSQYEVGNNSHPIVKDDIQFVADKIEYTGSSITFQILYWDLDFAPYLYIEGDSLEQTEIGVYHVILNFIKYDPSTGEGDAYWYGTNGDRSSYTLDFEIIERTKVALEYPKFDTYSQTFTGNEIEFHITNWVLLQDYLSYNVTFLGRDLGTNLKQVAAGVYTVTFSFNEDSIGYWNDDPVNPKKEYVVQFEIVDPNSGTKTLIYPKLQSTTANYTGSEIEFKIADWDTYYNAYADIVGSLINTEPGTYTVTVTIKSDVDATFADGTKEYSLSYTIISNSGDEVELSKPYFVQTVKAYTGSEVTFEIADWASKYSAHLDMSGDSLIQTEEGEYTITLSFKSTSKATWIGGSTDSVTLKFTITKDPDIIVEVVRLELPHLTKEAIEYNGGMLVFEIDDWENLSKYVTIDKGIGYLSSQTEVGVYTVTLRLIDTSVATWVGGLVEDIPLQFWIKQATLTVEGIDENGKLIVKNGADEQVNIDDYLIYIYRDGEGNIIPEDELKSGEEYFVSVKIDPEKEDDFKDTFTNDTIDFEQTLDEEINHQNGGKGVSFIKTSSSLSPAFIIAVAVVAVLVFLVITTIVILIIKRQRVREEEYYDDYYSNEYDYEEDDD